MAIDCDPGLSVESIKKIVARNYKLAPMLKIELIYGGKLLPDTMTFASIGVVPEKDTIVVVATQEDMSDNPVWVSKE